MRKLKKYIQFINEAFVLNSFYIKEKIPKIFQEAADKKIDSWFKDINRGNIPKDVNDDKLKLWYARNIYKITYNISITDLNQIYDRLKIKKLPSDEEYYTNLYKNAKNLIDYLKGNELTYKDELKYLQDLNSAVTQAESRVEYYNDMIKDYIFSSVRNEQIWKINYAASFDELYNTSVEWHKQLKASGSVTQESGKVLITYPDGFYWIDLETNDCSEEANGMGHCGRTSADTLLSLRQKRKNGEIEPFVTIAIDYDEDYTNEDLTYYSIIYQCKGKNNKKPIDKYHKYIIDLYLKFNIGKYVGKEYQPEYDFEITDVKDTELLKRILKEEPELIDIANTIFYKNEEFAKLLLEYYSYGLEGFIDEQYLVSNYWYLMQNNYITKEEFTERFTKDFLLENNEVYLKQKGELKDMSFMYKDSDGGRGGYSSRYVIEHVDDYEYYSDNKFSDLDLTLLSEKAIEEIERKITEIRQKNNDVDAECEDYDGWEEQIENVGKLYEIREAIKSSYSKAQESANRDDMYDEIVKPLLYFTGMKELKHYDDGILIKVNKNWLVRYDTYTKEYRNNQLSEDILENWFSSVGEDYDIEPEDDFLEINQPYYGWDGDIDKDTLDEILSDELANI